MPPRFMMLEQIRYVDQPTWEEPAWTSMGNRPAEAIGKFSSYLVQQLVKHPEAKVSISPKAHAFTADNLFPGVAECSFILYDTKIHEAVYRKEDKDLELEASK